MELTNRDLKHLKTVTDYLCSDEKKHYEDEGCPEGHVFVSVLGLQEILRHGTVSKNDNDSGPRRSPPGQGQSCFIFAMGRADIYENAVTPRYGQISAGHAPKIGEDFAETRWPVVVKVKSHVVESDLIQHLRDLADILENQSKPEYLQRTLADGRCGECGESIGRGIGVCMVCGRTM